MKHNVVLIVTSLLTILLLFVHLADDIIRGFAPGGVANVTGILIVQVWLYATLFLAGRRWGYVIMLVMSFFGAGISVVHMTGAGLGAGRSSGALFFVWTVLMIGVTSTFAFILSAQGLWRLRGSRPR